MKREPPESFDKKGVKPEPAPDAVLAREAAAVIDFLAGRWTAWRKDHLDNEHGERQ